jgi:ATP-binding cassette subfamily F protein 3
MAKIESEKKAEEKQKVQPVKKEEVKPAQVIHAKPVNNTPVNRDLQRELQKQQRRLSNLELDISKATAEKARLEQALSIRENYSDKKKFAQVESDYKKAKENLVALNKEYESLFEKVMELELTAK